MSESSEQKTDPASKRKLQKQREKGVVSQAAEMSNYASQLLAILILLATARWILSVMHLGIDNAIITMNAPLEVALKTGSENSIRIFLFSAAPIAFVALTSGILIKLMYQKGLTFATDPIIPNLEKISPSKGLKRIFGMRGWVELGMAIGRLTIWTGTFLGIAYAKFMLFFAAVPCGLPCIVNVGLETMQLLLVAACVLFLVFAMVEGLVQNFLFSHEQRMTKNRRQSRTQRPVRIQRSAQRAQEIPTRIAKLGRLGRGEQRDDGAVLWPSSGGAALSSRICAFADVVGQGDHP